MHELSLTQSAVDAIIARVGDAPVVCVRLSIGKLSGVVVDSVRFCFELVVEGTPLAGARLEISEPAGACRCRHCAREFGTDDPIVLCPACGGADVDVLDGREIRIASVEVRTACATPAAAGPTRGSA